MIQLREQLAEAGKEIDVLKEFETQFYDLQEKLCVRPLCMLIESDVDPPVPMQKVEYSEGELEDKVEELEREVYSITCTFTSPLMQYS